MLDYFFKRKDMASVTIGDVAIPVDPQLLFQRLLATVYRGNKFEHEDSFKDELSTIPPSLFGVDGLMWQADKPTLGKVIWKTAGASPNIFSCECHLCLRWRDLY